ncbi:zinc ABC transporter substrate-binding protein [Clostridium sp.]|uniref:metal ABC transporter solute-binding protein, Zn/Mn family n=1 Tax=Clostridium sp. TaxID=1506 RepID=UPI0032173D12
MKKLRIIGILMAATLIFTACSSETHSVSEEESGTINVVTSFYGMNALTQEIAGDKVTIKNIIPEGSEPHDFELKAKDMKAVEECDIFIYNGADMEEWIPDVQAAINSENVIMVEASKGVELINGNDTEADQLTEVNSEENHSDKDPHTWLGLNAAKIEAQNIKAALVEKDPENGSYYESNYEIFEKKIDGIIEEYNPKFQVLTNKNFITGHATFGYLCRDLGIVQHSIEGVFAEGEPSPKELENLIVHCKENNIKTIFVEELVSPALSDTLAKEVGGTTQQIYTLHSSEDGKSFSEALRYNVEIIYKTLSKSE